MSTQSMIKESLKEIIEVSTYCITFDKSTAQGWSGQYGCFGYPAAILLLSVVDSIGTLVEGGGKDTTQHFRILNNPAYYNLTLSQDGLRIMEKEFRNRLTHNSYMRPGIVLSLGKETDPVLVNSGEYYILNLKPFLKISKQVIEKILSET